MSGDDPGGYAAVTDLPERVEDLRDALAAEREVPTGRLLGLPELPEDDYWVDIAGAAAFAGVAADTIRSWVYRGQPRTYPFPTPTRVLYRLYWPASSIRDWRHQRAGSEQ